MQYIRQHKGLTALAVVIAIIVFLFATGHIVVQSVYADAASADQTGNTDNAALTLAPLFRSTTLANGTSARWVGVKITITF